MFWPAVETGGVPGELSRRVHGPFQPSHEMRTCRSQESSTWIATTPLCLARGACVVGTTRLLCVPPWEAEVLPAVPPTMRSPSPSEQLLLVFNHKRCGDTGPHSAPSKAARSAGGGEHCTDTREAEHLSCHQGSRHFSEEPQT